MKRYSGCENRYAVSGSRDDWEACRKNMDRLENYVLAYGIKEKHWKSKDNCPLPGFGRPPEKIMNGPVQKNK
ncbi:hypothetical protein [Sinobaca sp. H24]|uniref:hypothetical protein n=1 Tax=Sinobaca sp. H24 TaxID=2923376 RepID=UPI00207984DC|nr:hypothetical protein [Sinobaca sp. H24]